MSAPEPRRITVFFAFRTLLELLPPARRAQLVLLAVSMTLAAALDLVGIAAYYPVARVATDPEALREDEVLGVLYQMLGFANQRTFLLFLGGVALALLFLTIAVRALTEWLAIRFTRREHDRLALLLLGSYLRRSYAWFLQRNTATLTRAVTDEIHQAVKGVVLNLCKLFSSGVLALAVCVGVLWMDPGAALITATVFGIVYLLVYRALRRRLSSLGEERLREAALASQFGSEALACIKEARLPARPSLTRNFADATRRYNRVVEIHSILGTLPGFLARGLGTAGVLLVALYFFWSGRPDAIPLLTVYLVAVVKVVPALQSIYQTAVDIAFYLPSLQVLHAEIQSDSAREWSQADPLRVEHSAVLKGVDFSYPESELPAIRELDLELSKGAYLGLVGQTGSGKTTVADLLAGVLEPTRGEFLVDGHPLDALGRERWRSNVGYVPQEVYLIDNTVLHNIALGVPPAEIDRHRAQQAAVVANIHQFIVDELEQGYDTVLGERGVGVSGGQRQRLGIARALYHDPEILIFDEATSSLDSQTEAEVMAALNGLARKKTLVVVAHRLSTIEDCDRIYLFEKGRVVAQGSFAELVEGSESFRRLAGETGYQARS